MKYCNLILSFVALSMAAEPEYVRTTVYNVNGNGNNTINTDFYDGFGRLIQSKVQIDLTKDLTVSTFYDDAGRKNIVTKPYLNMFHSGNYFNVSLDEVKNVLSSQYGANHPVDKDYAFSQIEYYDDPAGKIKKNAPPGVQTNINSDHVSQYWYFGVARNNLTLTDAIKNGDVTFQDGLITSIVEGYVNGDQMDTVDVLDELYTFLLTANPFGAPDHYLIVTIDPDRHITQTLNDCYGKTVLTWANPSYSRGNEIISEYKYDILGNVLSEIAPEKIISETKYQYNTLGQLIYKETPDGGIEEMFYDDAGNLERKEWYFKDPGNSDQLVLKQRLSYGYDEFSRLIEVWVTTDAPNAVKKQIENFYDNIDDLSAAGDEYGIPKTVITELSNLRGRLAASICNNFVNGRDIYVIDLYSYNDEGEISKKFKIVPGNALQKITFEYDIHGKVKIEDIECGDKRIIKKYVYDKHGRLSEIIHENNANQKLVEYVYDSYGLVQSKNLLDQKDITYQYTIKDQIKNSRSTGSKGLIETLTYEPGGNISTSNFTYNNENIQRAINNTYIYDNISRLISVTATDENSNPLSESEAIYNYDKAGRFIRKKEGTKDLDNYQYYENNNRLKSYDSSTDVYLYDYCGRMVMDKRKKMVVQYNWRGLPKIFSFYSTIPAGITCDSKGTIKVDDSYRFSNLYTYMNKNSTKLSEIVMLYDVSGNRVLKMEGMQ